MMGPNLMPEHVSSPSALNTKGAMRAMVIMKEAKRARCGDPAKDALSILRSKHVHT